MTSHLIFGCTSRGGKLPDFISNHDPFPENVRTSIIVRGGGLISEIYEDIKSKIESIPLNEGNNIIVVFCAGLCDLTTKVKHDFGTEITYTRESSNFNNIIPDLTAIQSELFDRDIPVIFTCIPPASISKYRDFNFIKFDAHTLQYRLRKSLFSDGDIAEAQKKIEQDVKIINDQIVQLNFQKGMSNIRWDKPITKHRTYIKNNKRKKSSKFCYDFMYDGVHPDDYLSFVWYSDMCTTLRYYLLELSN